MPYILGVRERVVYMRLMRMEKKTVEQRLCEAEFLRVCVCVLVVCMCFGRLEARFKRTRT